MPTLFELTMHFFFQMTVILAMCRLVWLVFKRLGQVQVIATMAAGFILGPSVLGALWPDGQDWLFPTTVQVAGQSIVHPSLAVIYVVGQLGLVLYMFLVGASFKTEILTSHFRITGATASAGMLVPMVLGGITGAILFTQDSYFTEDITSWQAALFMAAAIAITAFPTLAWIIYDSNLHNTRLGTMSLSCAASDDAVSWILLATVVASTKDSMNGALLALFGGIGFVVFMFVVGKRLLNPISGWAERELKTDPRRGLPVGPLTVMLLVVLLCAWYTDRVGVYAVFGAFIAGVVMPRGPFLDTLRARTEPLVSNLLLPAFFVFAGLNTELRLIFDPSVLLIAIAVLVVSFVGKFGAVALTARYQGISWRESTAMGTLANARGMMELILLNIGLSEGLITLELYTILALMAFVTTFAATPVFRLLERNAWRDGLVFTEHGMGPAPGRNAEQEDGSEPEAMLPPELSGAAGPTSGGSER